MGRAQNSRTTGEMDSSRRIYTRKQWKNIRSKEKKRKSNRTCESSRKIYTRKQWDNFWIDEKKRKLNQTCESEPFGFVDVIDLEVDDPDETSSGKIAGKIVGEKSGASLEKKEKNKGSKEKKRNKKRKRNAGSEHNNHSEDYTELFVESSDSHLDRTEKVGGGGAGNRSLKDECEDCDGTFAFRGIEFALQPSILEKTYNQVEKSSKKGKEMVIDSGEHRDLGEENYYDSDYVGILDEYIAFRACRREMPENGVERNNGEEADKKNGSDTGDGSERNNYDYSSDVEKQAEKKRKKQKGKGKEKLDDVSVSPKVNNENDDAIWIEREELVPQSDLQDAAEKQMEKGKKEEKKVNSAPVSTSDSEEEKESLDESNGDPVKRRHVDDNKKLRSLKSKCNTKDGRNHEGPTYCLRSFSASKREMEEKKLQKAKDKMDVVNVNVSPKVNNENDDIIWITREEFVPRSDLQGTADKQMEKSKKEDKKVNPVRVSNSDCEDHDEEKELAEESKGDPVKERHFDDNKKLRSLKNKRNKKDGRNRGVPAYNLRSFSASKREAEERKLQSEEGESDTSSDEANTNVKSVKNNVDKEKEKVKPPFKRGKTKHGLGDLNFKKILLNSILENEDLTKKNILFRQENIPGQLPLKFRFEDEDPVPPEKDEWEKEIDGLFMDLQTGLLELKDTLTNQPLVDDDNIAAENHDDSAICCQKGRHLLILDEQIGLMCKYCSFVHRERKYILPSFVNKTGGRRGMKFFDELGRLSTDNFPQGGTAGNHCTSINGQGTVWDILPKGTKETMYPHQSEGFEFLWKNIAGDLRLENLKNILQSDDDGGKGCIISHAPGTGKTRLTIVFLQSFMKLFPACRPVIIAPCSMLRTWEEEFLKWEAGIPFHNLNNVTLSGMENSMALGFTNGLIRGSESKRILKLYTWAKGSGVLGITYRLFEQLVRLKENQEDEKVREILLKVPGLVVLDEGHTPRNNESLIWKSLTKLDTPRRIILSGTPFQNNFDELYNTLCLVCPKLYGSEINCARKRKLAKKRWDRLANSIGKNKDVELNELKRIIAPLVHVHKGHILQERLPGLRSTLVYLKPTHLQQDLFRVIPQKKLFEEDFLMTWISVHPSLVKDRNEFSDYCSELEPLELLPDEGIKTKFLFALIHLSNICGEKVIVFSQFIAPMDLIKKQLESVFGWVEGREVLHMNGDVDVQRRQASINNLNDPKSEVKVLLASTRACCEGINLVGASRVILLDAVWNPSVKRQAVSRAYRIGQTKIVHAYQLISSTLEAKKYARQAKKDLISELIFSTSDCKRDNLPVSEDKILEAMFRHPDHRDMFERLVHDPKESDLFDSFDFVE